MVEKIFWVIWVTQTFFVPLHLCLYARKRITHTVNERLVITYSKERAKKDADNRRRGVDRLRKAFGSGTIKKESLNRRGYNKFLEITKDVGIYINEEKVADDARWDGWKGYLIIGKSRLRRYS